MQMTQAKNKQIEEWIGDLQVKCEDLDVDNIKAEQAELAKAIDKLVSEQRELQRLQKEDRHDIQKLLKHAGKARAWMKRTGYTKSAKD